MTKSYRDALVGEMAHHAPESHARQHGAFHPAIAGRELKLARPAAKRPLRCKSCDGRHCVGRCRF